MTKLNSASAPAFCLNAERRGRFILSQEEYKTLTMKISGQIESQSGQMN